MDLVIYTHRMSAHLLRPLQTLNIINLLKGYKMMHVLICTSIFKFIFPFLIAWDFFQLFISSHSCIFCAKREFLGSGVSCTLAKHPICTSRFLRIFFFFKYIYWLCYYSCPICPPTPLHPAHPPPSHIPPPYSSCPWVILISSLASTVPTLFLPSPCLFSTYHLCYFFSVPLPHSPPPTPLLTSLHVISISMVLFLF